MTSNLDFSTRDTDRKVDLSGVTGTFMSVVLLGVGQYAELVLRYTGLNAGKDDVFAAERTICIPWYAKGGEFNGCQACTFSASESCQSRVTIFVGY